MSSVPASTENLGASPVKSRPTSRRVLRWGVLILALLVLGAWYESTRWNVQWFNKAGSVAVYISDGALFCNSNDAGGAFAPAGWTTKRHSGYSWGFAWDQRGGVSYVRLSLWPVVLIALLGAAAVWWPRFRSTAPAGSPSPLLTSRDANGGATTLSLSTPASAAEHRHAVPA